jgi:hypothetical protein
MRLPNAFIPVFPGLAAIALGAFLFASADASAEIVFQDFFAQPAGSITDSVPWIDVEGNGWQSGGAATQLALDGAGHFYNSATNAGAAAGVQLIPVGPHGSLMATALMELPAGSTESIDMGYGEASGFLTATNSGSGPWVQVKGNGTMVLFGGVGQNNPVTAANAFTNNGNPVEVFLTYDAFHATASAGTVNGGVTNLVFNQLPLTNSAGLVSPNYLLFQLTTNLTTPTARWAAAVSVDWYPRAPPMLALPVAVASSNVVQVGPPGTNDIALIQTALNKASNSTNAMEIRFTAGATYVISNTMLTANTPLGLQRGTNVLVNGNGCKILITNPHAGFLTVNNSSNVIVEGFSVDYNPLPFTQGVVSHNFETSNDVIKEAAIEFMVDAGYPVPTNANYVDPNANRWGMIIDPTQPGRVANGAFAQCFYTNVVQTNVNGAFKVYLNSSTAAQTIQAGQHWCMISRWNSSIVFNSSLSWQVTYLSNTIYTGAGPVFVGEHSAMISEVNDVIEPGPPPTNATALRLRASNADGGLFVESRIGPWVQGCSFTGLSDDIANVCLAPFIITNAPAYPTNTFALFQNTSSVGTPSNLVPFQVEVGDRITFYNATNGVVFDRAIVTAVSLPNVTFDHAIANVVAGSYISNTMLINETLNTSAVYLDNQFSDSAFHGIYCRADNVLIAHNNVSGMAYAAICAFPAITVNFLNFFVPTNVVIMDNVLSDEGFSYQALHNAIPSAEPVFAMIGLNKADDSTQDVTNGFEISGIRILCNAFLDWHRAPLTLHNATDVIVSGNYFGPPETNDGLVPLANDVIADLWVSDYPNLKFVNNVNATTLSDGETVSADGTNTTIANAFQLPAGPRLAASLAGGDVTVSWTSPSPGFVLQQAGSFANGGGSWVDVTNEPVLAGASNVVSFPVSGAGTNQFYRARQR